MHSYNYSRARFSKTQILYANHAELMAVAYRETASALMDGSNKLKSMEHFEGHDR